MTSRVEGFLTGAAAEPAELSIRQLLAVWGFRFRTPDTTGVILRDLAAAGLQCCPDLVEGDLNTIVRVAAASFDAGNVAEEPPVGDPGEDQPIRLPHIFPSIGDIPSATNGIAKVAPTDMLQDAQGIMIEQDYSQLAVMTGPYELVGAVSWRSIAQARLRNPVITLSSAIDHEPKVVRTRDKLLDQIDTIYDADFVFVRDASDEVCGIVTTADLSARFRDLTKPFFELGEIEHRMRECLKEKGITLDEIRPIVRNNKLQSIDDMTFGNYFYLLSSNDIWQKMGWEVSQARFLGYLRSVKDIRNRVAHYDAIPLSQDEMRDLKYCLNYMRRLNQTSWA